LSVLAFTGDGESELCHLRSVAREHQNELIKGELSFGVLTAERDAHTTSGLIMQNNIMRALQADALNKCNDIMREPLAFYVKEFAGDDTPLHHEI
jgi:thermostable 8-oxoguanine DNA glycosylase